MGEKKARNGNYTRRRGYEGEREFVNLMKDAGHDCRRHLMSGMFEKGDCTLTLACMPDDPLKGQIKRKKQIPAWMELDNHHFTAVRGDRGDWSITMSLEMFLAMAQ